MSTEAKTEIGTLGQTSKGALRFGGMTEAVDVQTPALENARATLAQKSAQLMPKLGALQGDAKDAYKLLLEAYNTAGEDVAAKSDALNAILEKIDKGTSVRLKADASSIRQAQTTIAEQAGAVTKHVIKDKALKAAIPERITAQRALVDAAKSAEGGQVLFDAKTSAWQKVDDLKGALAAEKGIVAKDGVPAHYRVPEADYSDAVKEAVTEAKEHNSTWQEHVDSHPDLADAREKATKAANARNAAKKAIFEGRLAVVKDPARVVSQLGDKVEETGAKALGDAYAEKLEGKISTLENAATKTADAAEGIISDARASELNAKGFWARNAGAIKENMWSEKAWESGSGKVKVGVRGAGALVGGYQALKGVGQTFSRDEETGESQVMGGIVRTAIGATIGLAALRGFTGKVNLGPLWKAAEGAAKGAAKG